MPEEVVRFRCKEENCKGTVTVSQENKCAFGRRGCGGYSPPLYPCDTCGKLHTSDGEGARNRGGDPLFLTEKGFAARQKDGTMIHF